MATPPARASWPGKPAGCVKASDRCHPPSPEEDPYGRQATLAQCSLVCGELARADEEFRTLRTLVGGHWMRLVTTRRQARLMLAWLAEDRAGPSSLPTADLEAIRVSLEEKLTPPRLMLFAGHMVDLPDRPAPRLPEDREAWLRAEIVRRLDAGNVGFGFSAAACGADILFLETLLARGGEAHIVLPFGRAAFRRQSVVRVPEHARWGERFDRLVEAATTFAELTDSFSLSAANAVSYANQVLHGRALWRAVEFDTGLSALAAWDGREEGVAADAGGGGTLNCVRQWHAHHCPVDIISLAPAATDGAPAAPAIIPSAPARANGQGVNKRRIDEAIRATLCGEWVPPDSARLHNEKRRLAARRAFFARVAEILAPFRPQMLDLTVEDHRFRLLFAGLLPAAQAARALRAGLHPAGAPRRDSQRFATRLGLHAGPVARMENALLDGHAEPVGTHWQKAERLVSLATAGRIILSREAAALLAVETAGGRDAAGAEKTDDWHCEYQGRGAFGEPFGRQGIYAL